MACFLLRVEGVNFAATLYDTSDLSTIRGASLALLRVDEVVLAAIVRHGGKNPSLVFSGASQVVITFEAPNPDEAERITINIRNNFGKETPYNFLSFVVDSVPIDGRREDTALMKAEARNRASQLRQWTIDIPDFAAGTKEYDARDRARPATATILVPPQNRVTVATADDDGFVEENASASVAGRREYGRKERQKFYKYEVAAAADGLHFADSFADIVGDPPEEMPLSLRNKMAVVYADGNGFTGIRGSDIENIKGFSKALKKYHRAFLRSILEWFRSGGCDPRFRLAFSTEDHRKHHPDGLRFETLLWGGDEFLFVMPSWLAVTFIKEVFNLTRDWKFQERKLTYSVGVVICHHKTPIRQMRVIAKELAETCKKAMKKTEDKQQNAVSLAIFESYAPFDTDLADYRNRLLNAHTEEQQETLARMLVLPGDRFGELISTLVGLKDEKTGLPRSQIYSILRDVRANGGYFNENANAQAAKQLSRYRKRAGAERDISGSDVVLPFLGSEKRRLALDLALAAELWDYIKPFPENMPPFPEKEGQ